MSVKVGKSCTQLAVMVSIGLEDLVFLQLENRMLS